MGCACIQTANKANRNRSQKDVLTRQVSTNTRTILKELSEIPHHYCFKKVLGHGKFGRVLLWESQETNHQFAIKAITKGEFPFSRMIEEINILSKVDHPNIIKYIKSFQSKKYLYVVMEYCPGSNLFQKIVKQGKFGEAEAINIMQEILRAINHCHYLGIIHRDLKPENIMYSDDETLKIIDFGLSMMENTFSLERLAGTKYYIAPEVLRDGTYTKACDIWSLGVIMNVLLSGYMPIVGTKVDEIFENTMKFTGPNFTGAVWSSISSEAKDLITKMMNSDHKKRISASDALEHPWFKLKKETLVQSIPDILMSLKKYSEASQLKRKLLKLLFKGVNDLDFMHVKKAFVELDKNNTGLITCKDLEAYLKSIGNETTAQELEAFTRKINKDGEAYINYSDFIEAAIATKQFLTDEKLEHLFKILDINNQGTISSTTFKAAIDKGNLQEIDPITLVGKVEVGISERITFEQFKVILLN